MDVKTFSGDIELRTTEGKPGKFKALICTFGVVDKGGDVVHRGAFTASLGRWRARNARINVLWNHGTDDPENIIGQVNPHDCQETDKGLIVSGELYLDEDRGQKVYRQLQRGTLREWSYGCLIESAKPRGNGGRDYFGLELFEVSPTLIGKGATETLMVTSALARPSSSASSLTPGELLAPYRARFDVMQQRVTRRRNPEA